MSLVVMTTILIVLVLLRVPVAYALGASSLAYAWWVGYDLTVFVQRVIGSIDSYSLLAIPLFLLAAELMNSGGLTRRLIDAVLAWVGWVRGGLAVASVGAGVMFAGMSGSAVSEAGGLGSVFIPAMRKRGYSPGFGPAVIANTSILGVILPPSIPLIVYGILAGVSVGDLLLSGVVPGILMALLILVVTLVISRRRNFPREARFSLRNALSSSWSAVLALALPVVLVGGLRSGLFNTTEASGVAVFYVLVIGLLFYRELTLHKLVECLTITGRRSAQVLVIFGFSGMFGWIVAREGVARDIAQFVDGLGMPTIALVLSILVIGLLIGTIMEPLPAMLIFVPVLTPVAHAGGADPVAFGFLFVTSLSIGLVTPPVGICLQLCARIAGVTDRVAIKESLPYFAVLVGVLVLIAFVPSVATWLPSR